MPAIPDRVVEVIHGPAFMQLGTRDDRLQPSHAWVVGAVVSDDRETVTAFVAEAAAGRTLDNLRRNGQVALAIALATHECYQVKGRYVSHRPVEPSERARQESYRAALFASALAAGYPEAIARPFALGFAYAPAVAITLRADAVFVQTPGPDAGAPLT